MQARTDTLASGSPAPEFTLKAVNEEASYSLSELISDHKVIVEFMRGTW
jgi:peroxiredoxin